MVESQFRRRTTGDGYSCPAGKPFSDSYERHATSLASQSHNFDGHAAERCSMSFDLSESMTYLVDSLKTPETTRKSSRPLFPSMLEKTRSDFEDNRA
jgi:hypothetical protein